MLHQSPVLKLITSCLYWISHLPACVYDNKTDELYLLKKKIDFRKKAHFNPMNHFVHIEAIVQGFFILTVLGGDGVIKYDAKRLKLDECKKNKKQHSAQPQ